MFSSVQILFIHMDQMLFLGVISLFVNLETFFAAYNFSYKEVRFVIFVFAELHLFVTLAFCTHVRQVGA